MLQAGPGASGGREVHSPTSQRYAAVRQARLATVREGGETGGRQGGDRGCTRGAQGVHSSVAFRSSVVLVGELAACTSLGISQATRNTESLLLQPCPGADLAMDS